MAITTQIEGFSLTHAQVLDGNTSFATVLAANYAVPEAQDIYGVNEGKLDLDSDSYENEGDDAVLSTWAWGNYATVEIQGGYIPFSLIARLTGQTLMSSTIATKQVLYLDLWSESSFNVAPFPMVLKMPAKDATGKAASLLIGLFKVSPDPITFDGPAYKDGLKLNYGGKALLSTTDEMGRAFMDGQKRIGRILAIES